MATDGDTGELEEALEAHESNEETSPLSGGSEVDIVSRPDRPVTTSGLSAIGPSDRDESDQSDQSDGPAESDDADEADESDELEETSIVSVDVEPLEESSEADDDGGAGEDEDEFVGTRLKGTFEITEKIGEGGMGAVYSAIQHPLGRRVAVKLVKPDEATETGEHYFKREAEAINRLRHPNIINVVDFGAEDDGLLYLVTEYLPGQTLRNVIAQDFPFHPERICNICIQVLSALEQAHSRGVVHCDLKPANIMVERVAGQEDFVKVLDFGIAKIKGPAVEVGPYTQAGDLVGTFDYMSPEQVMRKDLDGRADVWSVGVMLYELLTQRRIFHAEDGVTIIARVLRAEIEPPSELVDGVTPIFDQIAMKALERDLDERYESAAAFRDALIALRERLRNGGVAVETADGNGAGTSGGAPGRVPDTGELAAASSSIELETPGLDAISEAASGASADPANPDADEEFGDDFLDEVFDTGTLEETLFGELSSPREVAGAREVSTTRNVWVDRGTPRKQLARRARQVRGGAGAGVALLGGAGSGKSAFLGEVLADLEENGWLTVCVHGRLASEIDHHEVVRRWARGLSGREDPAAVARRVCESLGLTQRVDHAVEFLIDGGRNPGDGELPWQSLQGFIDFSVRFLTRLACRAAEGAPVCLAVDDLNVEDDRFTRLLEALRASVADEPVILLGTARSAGMGAAGGVPSGFDVIQVPGFSSAQTSEYLEARLGVAPSRAAVRAMIQDSDGHPGTIDMLVEALILEERTDAVSAESGGALPSLREALVSILDGMNEARRTLLTAAAIARRPVDVESVLAVAGVEEQGDLDWLVRRGILEGHRDEGVERVRVAEGRLGRLAVDTLPQGQRLQWHRRWLDALGERVRLEEAGALPQLAAMGAHFRARGSAAEAADVYRRLGILLERRLDVLGAVRAWEDGMRVANELESASGQGFRDDLKRRLLQAYRAIDRRTRAHRLLKSLPPDERLCERDSLGLVREVGETHQWLDHPRKAAETFQALESEARRRRAPIWLAWSLLGRAEAAESTGDKQRAATFLRDAGRCVAKHAELDFRQIEHRRLYWTVYNQFGALLLGRGDLKRAEKAFERALQRAQKVADQSGIARVLSNFGALYLGSGKTDRARQYFLDALGVAGGSGDVRDQVRILTNAGIAAMRVNDLAASRDFLNRAGRLATEIRWQEGLSQLGNHVERLRQKLRR